MRDADVRIYDVASVIHHTGNVHKSVSVVQARFNVVDHVKRLHLSAVHSGRDAVLDVAWAGQVDSIHSDSEDSLQVRRGRVGEAGEVEWE